MTGETPPILIILVAGRTMVLFLRDYVGFTHVPPHALFVLDICSTDQAHKPTVTSLNFALHQVIEGKGV